MPASQERFDRRRFLSGGARTVAAAALGGVGAPLLLSDCSSAPGRAVATPGVSRAAPRRGGSVKIGMNSEIDGFSPFSDNWDNTGLTYANTVYDTLTAIAADGSAQPYLAESVTPNGDYSVWTITLRPDVFFHDGTPLDAGVLVANFEAFKASPLTGQALAPVLSARRTGHLVVEMVCSQPLVPFPYYLSTQVGVVVAPSMIDPPAGTSPKPVGTGPFVYEDWVPNSHFSATRNPRYWRPGLPYLDSVTYFPIADDGARLESLQSGSVDLMISTNPSAVTTLRSNPAYQLVDTIHHHLGEPDMDFIMLNTAVAPTDDPEVRLALAKAIDYEAIVELFGGGLTQPSSGLFPPGSIYYAPSSYPTYDLAGARALVDKARSRHGGAISLDLGTIPDPRDVQATQAIQSMWEKAGFSVTLSQTDQATFIENALEGKFHAYTWEQFSAPDPDLNYPWWSTTTVGPVGGISLNFARNYDPEIQAALEEGREHANPATRIAAYRRVNERLALDLPYLWLARTIWSAGANDSVMNFSNPTLPSGQPAEGFSGGVLDPTPIWLRA